MFFTSSYILTDQKYEAKRFFRQYKQIVAFCISMAHTYTNQLSIIHEL